MKTVKSIPIYNLYTGEVKIVRHWKYSGRVGLPAHEDNA